MFSIVCYTVSGLALVALVCSHWHERRRLMRIARRGGFHPHILIERKPQCGRH